MPDSPITDQPAFDREHVAGLISRERETYGQRHARSGHAFGTGGTNLLGGVPMTWMRPCGSLSRSAASAAPAPTPAVAMTLWPHA